MAEVIRLRFDMPGIGNKGDYIVSDPDHPNPKLTLCRLVPLDPSVFPDVVRRVEASGLSESNESPEEVVHGTP